MPVIYSFTTTIAMPTSGIWPCMDIGEASMPNILLMTETAINRGTPWITFDGNNDMVVLSDDGQPTIFTIDLNIGQKFTFETTFKPSSLPLNLDNLDKSYFFIAMFDAQDNAGGLLLSQSGLAIVSAFGNTVAPIAGSQNVLPQSDDYYVLRMVVDGSQNLMDIYVTKLTDYVVSGHQLQYTTAAPVTPSSQPDQIRIELKGSAAAPVQGKFSTFRANCTGLNVPNLRPIADTGQDQAASIDSIIQLDGRGSYDPEGAQLTFLWSLVGAPEDSAFRLDGLGGFTQDDGDGDGWTTMFEGAGDPWSLANAPSLQPGDVLVVNDTQFIVSSNDWVYNSTTGVYDRDVGFDPNKLEVELERLPDDLTGAAWIIYYQSTFFNDRTLPQPTFVPDVPGLYALQLVVNDGELDSLPNSGLVNIAESNVPLGVVPDVNFIWDYISDAWNLFSGVDPITTIWSGFAQVVGNLLFTAWQLDYAKSLVDIQRVFQRRWLNYDFLLEEPTLFKDAAVFHFVRGRIIKEVVGGTAVFANETLILSRDGGDQVVVELDGTLTTQEIADAINEGLGEKIATTKTASVVSGYLVLDYDGLLVVHKEGTANATLDFALVEDTQNELRGGSGTVGSVDTAFVVTDPLIDFAEEDAQKNDILLYDGEGYEILKIAGEKQLTTAQSVPSSSAIEWLVASTIKSEFTDFSAELVRYGDIVEIQYWETGEVEVGTACCKCLGARNNHLGFDPRPLYEAVGGNIDGYDLALHRIRRVTSIPVNELVNRVPRLQEVVLDPPEVLSQNLDYTISTNADGVRGIHFVDGLFSMDNPPPDRLWAEQTILDNRPMIEANFGKAVDFLVEDLESRTDDLDYLAAVRGLWYAFFHGPSVRNVLIGTQILLGLPFAEVNGIIDDINLTYSATQIRVLIRDALDNATLRSYFIPRNVKWEEDGESMIAVNPATGVEYEVGDEVEQFAPLSKGVDVFDWINNPTWWQGYNNQGAFLEVEKFFHFMVQADIDVFNITNLVFAIDFVKKIKPSYTYPWWVVLKRLAPDYISVTDAIEFDGTLYLYDDPACGVSMEGEGVFGSYRFDDTDESGNHIWAFDGAPLGGSTKPEFLYDKRRLCPEEFLRAIMTAYHSGGLFPFDWIWAFDDGGGNDDPPLSGPLVSPPPSGGPYGALVGVVKFDQSYGAGYYTRGKVL